MAPSVVCLRSSIGPGSGRTVRAGAVSAVRALRLDFQPSAEPDASKPAADDLRIMRITLARDRAALDASLKHVWMGLLIAGTALIAAIVVATFVIVRRSLRPLNAIADRAT